VATEFLTTEKNMKKLFILIALSLMSTPSFSLAPGSNQFVECYRHGNFVGGIRTSESNLQSACWDRFKLDNVSRTEMLTFHAGEALPPAPADIDDEDESCYEGNHAFNSADHGGL
jgi:hypothetical protein